MRHATHQAVRAVSSWSNIIVLLPSLPGPTVNQLLPEAGQMFKAFWDRSEINLFPWSNRQDLKRVSNFFKHFNSTSSTQIFHDNHFLSIFGSENSEFAATAWHAIYVWNYIQVEKRHLIWFAVITGNSTLEPLLEGLFAQIHMNLSWRVFGRNRTGDLRITKFVPRVPRSSPLS